MTGLPKKTILAVDDARANLDVVKAILAPVYTVKAAISGKMALKIVEKQKPDLILLDIMMPEMDGYEVCRLLKEAPGTRDIPIIFLTAKDQSMDEAKGFELGAADYIHKPFSPPVLLARVATHLMLRQNMEELEKAYAIIKVQKDRMETELNVGRDIQMSMIPAIMPDRDEFSLHAILKPAREVGGDFYDFFFIDDQHFCFLVGDVSGKGVPAALFMAVSKTVIKSRSANDFSPASILSHANNDLSDDNPNNMFVTLLLAVLDLRTGALVYCNAGHNPPLIRRASGEVALLTERHGRIAGAMGGMAYKESTDRLERGDLIVLYTDGVTEALNADNELLGEDRLVAVVEPSTEIEVETIVDKIVAAVHEFEAGTEQTDDVTVLVLRFDAETALSSAHDKIVASNDLSEIPRVTEEIDRFCKARGVDQSVNRKVNVVIDDHLNNVISYAFDDGAAHEIEVDLTLQDDELTVRVSDNGVPFDPLAAAQPDTSTNLEDRPIGGLGLELIRTLPDEIDYARQEGRNVVTAVFYLSRTDAVS